MGRASSEAKERWNRKTYQRYTINLRKVEDAEMIKFVEAHREKYGVTDLFRMGIEAAMREENE